MKYLKKWMAAFLCLAALNTSVVAFAQSQDQAEHSNGVAVENDVTKSKDVKEIEQVIKNYAQSIDTIDIGLAEKIWQTNEQTTFIHPRGTEVGWEAVKNNFYKEVMGQTFSKRQLNIHDVNIQVYGNSAVAMFTWDFPAIFRTDGTPITTYGRESQVYKKTADGWRIVHVHYSNMPVTGAKKGF